MCVRCTPVRVWLKNWKNSHCMIYGLAVQIKSYWCGNLWVEIICFCLLHAQFYDSNGVKIVQNSQNTNTWHDPIQVEQSCTYRLSLKYPHVVGICRNLGTFFTLKLKDKVHSTSHPVSVISFSSHSSIWHVMHHPTDQVTLRYDHPSTHCVIINCGNIMLTAW